MLALYVKKAPMGLKIIMATHIPNIGEMSPCFAYFSPIVEIMW
jgi:hypothetical protein